MDKETLKDIIFVSLEDWDEIWRRNQFICSKLAQNNPDIKILFVGRPYNLFDFLRKPIDFFTDRERKAYYKKKFLHWKFGTKNINGYKNLYLLTTFKLLPSSLSVGRKINNYLEIKSIKRAQSKLKINNPTLWINPYYAIHLIGQFNESQVIYDITDDWTEFNFRAKELSFVKSGDDTLTKRADKIIVCSKALYDKKIKQNKNTYLIPNGVDFEHYSDIFNKTNNIPKDISKIKKPILGYTGSLHEERIDISLLEYINEKEPDWSIVLVGPNFMSKETTNKLKRLSNIYLFGSRGYKELPYYMKAFDICVIPHKVSDFTESLNPIKVYEYLATGKPVVTTDIAGAREYKDVFKVAKTYEEFVKFTDDLLKNDNNDLKNKKLRYAKENSWQRRVEEIEKILR